MSPDIRGVNVYDVAGEPGKTASLQPAGVAPVAQFFPSCFTRFHATSRVSAARRSRLVQHLLQLYVHTHRGPSRSETADTWAKNSSVRGPFLLDADGNLTTLRWVDAGVRRASRYRRQLHRWYPLSSTGDCRPRNNCRLGTPIRGRSPITGERRGDDFAWTGSTAGRRWLGSGAPEPHGGARWRWRLRPHATSSTGR